MPTVKFTYALKRFFPELKNTPAKGNTLASVLQEMDIRYPGVRSYLLDERGSLRPHVNIFIGDTIIKDRVALSDPFPDNGEIYIMQALSGG